MEPHVGSFVVGLGILAGGVRRATLVEISGDATGEFVFARIRASPA
jgi:hypothetical protein